MHSIHNAEKFNARSTLRLISSRSIEVRSTVRPFREWRHSKTSPGWHWIHASRSLCRAVCLRTTAVWRSSKRLETQLTHDRYDQTADPVLLTVVHDRRVGLDPRAHRLTQRWQFARPPPCASFLSWEWLLRLCPGGERSMSGQPLVTTVGFDRSAPGWRQSLRFILHWHCWFYPGCFCRVYLPRQIA